MEYTAWEQTSRISEGPWVREAQGLMRESKTRARMFWFHVWTGVRTCLIWACMMESEPQANSLITKPQQRAAWCQIPARQAGWNSLPSFLQCGPQARHRISETRSGSRQLSVSLVSPFLRGSVAKLHTQCGRECQPVYYSSPSVLSRLTPTGTLGGLRSLWRSCGPAPLLHLSHSFFSFCLFWLFLFLFWLCGLWDLSTLIRYQTQALFSEKAEPLTQGAPVSFIHSCIQQIFPEYLSSARFRAGAVHSVMNRASSLPLKN